MINSIVHFFTGKDIVLYEKHRQTLPIVNKSKNKQSYWFVQIGPIWKCIPFRTIDKRKHKIMHFVLSCIQPKYILSMNWLTKRESLYKVWTAQHPKSKFIVVQHGAYVGGVVTDVPHKYTKCDVFLTWGPFFTDVFNRHNFFKNVKIISFGNTLYNSYNRDNYRYRENNSNKILLLPTALNDEKLIHFNTLLKKLQELDFQVVVKEHSKQGVERDEHGALKFPIIQDVTKISGSLYQVLENNDYEFIVSDHSSSLLDAIFFKNKVLYFDPNNNNKGYTTQYSRYLTNIYSEDYEINDQRGFREAINIDQQEKLFSNMVILGNNKIVKSLF